MSKNGNLQKARQAKNDEFYTQLQDINSEVDYYYEYDNNVFRDKNVLLPCDDPEWSNFTRYFVMNFDKFGLKKLISTSYASESKRKLHQDDNGSASYIDKITDFEISSPKFDKEKTKTHGKVFILDRDATSDKTSIDNLTWDYLEGDGDFRSEEVTKLRDEADVIITNPPFSLFKDFLPWIMEADKEFLIVANDNVRTYKEVFPLIKENKIWIGAGRVKEFVKPDGTTQKFGNVGWMTNLDNAKRHEPLTCLTMKDNLTFNDRLIKTFEENYGKVEYPEYDKHNVMEVPFVKAIPKDYTGIMGVPISFLDKYCPEQFEIIGDANHGSDNEYDLFKPIVNGKECFKRILIKYTDTWIPSHPEDFKF